MVGVRQGWAADASGGCVAERLKGQYTSAAQKYMNGLINSLRTRAYNRAFACCALALTGTRARVYINGVCHDFGCDVTSEDGSADGSGSPLQRAFIVSLNHTHSCHPGTVA